LLGTQTGDFQKIFQKTNLDSKCKTGLRDNDAPGEMKTTVKKNVARSLGGWAGE